MAPPFHEWGNFKENLPHELFIYLMESEFTGKLELLFDDNITRTIHFINGEFCAAVSSVATEQTDKIIEMEISSDLDDESQKIIEEKIKAGNSYSQALVDAEIISATDLLNYAIKQAENVITNALATTPLEYKILDEKPKRVNPLDIDPANLLRKSIVNDLDPEHLSTKIGDESVCYLMSEEFDDSSSKEKEEEELKALFPHLDGRRSVEEISSKIGLNPDRTRRLILFLKLMHWLEPAFGTENEPMVESSESLMAVEESAATKYEENPLSVEEESAEILELLDDDDSYQAETEIAGMPSLDQEDIVQLSEQSNVSEEPDFGSESENDQQDDSSFEGVLSTKSSPGKFRVLYMMILPLVFGVIAIGSITISILSNSSNSQKIAGADLSFYPDTVEIEQLPLDKDFSEDTNPDSKAMRIEIGPPEQIEQAQEDQAKESPAVENTRVEPTVETPVKQAEPEQKPDIQPVVGKTEDPESKPGRSLNRPQQNRVVRSWDEAQPLALDEGVRGRWVEAAIIWSGPLSVLEQNTHTVLISTSEQAGYISSVFERFANSSSLRNEFFVIKRTNGGFYICWGIFPNANATTRAMRTLPTRVQQFRPSLRKLSTLQGK